MFHTPCLRSLSRATIPVNNTIAKRLTRWTTTQIQTSPSSTRAFSILTPRRPVLSSPLPSLMTQTFLPQTPTTELDLLPKMSAHPSLAGIQVRNGPRDTFDPSHRIRKRRHGFLSRVKGGHKGKALLRRRRSKRRSTLSH